MVQTRLLACPSTHVTVTLIVMHIHKQQRFIRVVVKRRLFTFTYDGAFSRHVFPDIRRTTQTRLLRTSNYMATPRHVTGDWERAPLARSIPMVAGHFKQVPPLTHTNLPTSAFPDTRVKNRGNRFASSLRTLPLPFVMRFSSSTGLVMVGFSLALRLPPFTFSPFFPLKHSSAVARVGRSAQAGGMPVSVRFQRVRPWPRWPTRGTRSSSRRCTACSTSAFQTQRHSPRRTGRTTSLPGRMRRPCTRSPPWRAPRCSTCGYLRSVPEA